MPIVPIEQNEVNLPQPGIGASVQPADMGAGEAMIGRAVQGLGAEGSDAATVLNQVNTIHDHAVTKEGYNSNVDWVTQNGYSGPNAFFALKGRDAVAALPGYLQSFNDNVAQVRDSLNSPRQQQMYDLTVGRYAAEQRDKASIYAAQQEKTYNEEQNLGTQATTKANATLSYLNDPPGAEKQISTGTQAVADYWSSQGAPQPYIAAKQLEYTSDIYKNVGTQIAWTGPNGPQVAQALMDQHGAEMTPDDRLAVATHIRAAQGANDEAARRAAAEQRQQDQQARSDARLRADSVAGNLDSGIPLDPKTYASAITDAQTAQDPGLLKRLQEGQLKNTTMFGHQGDTPIALQDQINTMSAQIVQAGTKADPSMIVQRNALQQLYDRSAEQLKSNGVGYVAQHLGLQPQPLNLADPNSVNARIQLVQQGSARTGTEIAPLQPSEVQPLAQTWRNGDAGAKQALVMQLAQFGPHAGSAAQQISPNDAGLVHLIGLASQSNRGVALSRLGQALAGYDALKTEGKLVGKVASEGDFNLWTGSALQFMPGAKDGVFTVAKALLAEDANQHGWDSAPGDGGSAPADGKAWWRAVNSALGAYNRGEVQYGGLAAFNGAQTVLPENMSLDDLEQRWSRANDQQFRAAANGVPATGNGTVLGAGDLRSMHLIPVDDGVYRLEQGGSFVHLKDGRTPFEIDVRKLPSAAAQGFNSSAFNAQISAAGYTRH